jgi:hypothetical protein
MIRIACLSLIAATLLVGCEEPETSRVVPVSSEDAKPARVGRTEGSSQPRDVTVPKNIPMH